ncbi:MAG: GAF domain-containing protein, partial [Anaerolineales bacterium]|nr:GAF domain-containing protein [Anaerolineales bacterium]
MLFSFSIPALIATLSLSLFLGLLSFFFWLSQRKARTSLWLAAWLIASAAFVFLRLLQHAPLADPAYLLIPRLQLTAAYSLAWWGYGLGNASSGYQARRREQRAVLLVVILLILVVWAGDLVLTEQIVLRSTMLGDRFHGVQAGVLYLPASLVVLALALIPTYRLYRAPGPNRGENYLLATGFLFVILISLSDFLVTYLNLGWPRLSDFSHLPVAITFSFIQVRRFGRLYRDLDQVVHQRTRELRQANQTLHESEARYKLLFDHTPAGILLVDPHGQIMAVNASALQMLGSPSAQATQGINMFSFPPLIQAGVSANVQKCFELGQTVEDQHLYTSKWGRSIQACIRYIPILNEAGTTTLVQVIAEDTTEQAQAEKLQESVYEIARAAITDQSLEQLYAKIHHILQQLLPTQYFYIAIYDQANQLIAFPYFQDPYDIAPPPAKLGRGLTEYVLRSRQPILVTPQVLKRLVENGEVELVGPDSVEWLGVPLVTHEQAIGVMVVQSYDEHVHFSAQDLEVMSYVSTQVANAIERKQAEQALQAYARQLETLNTVTAMLSTSLALKEVLRLILEQIRKVITVNSAAIFLKEAQGLRIVIDWNITPSLVGQVFAEDELLYDARGQDEPLIIDQPLQDARFKNWGTSKTIQTWIGVPLMVRDSLIGFMTLDSDRPHALPHDQIPLIKSFAAQSAQAVDNARQFGNAQRRLERLAALHEIDQTIVSNLDLDTRLAILLGHILRQLQVDAALILLSQPEDQTLEYVAGQGFHTQALRHTSLRLGKGYAGRVALERRIIQVPDLTQVETSFLRSPEFHSEGFHAYIGVPLIAKGEVIGVLEIYHRQVLAPDFEWLEFLDTLAGQAAIAIDNLNIFNELQRSNQELVQAYDATIEGW